MMRSHGEGGTIADTPQKAPERHDAKPARSPEAAGSGAVCVWLLGRFEVSIGSRVIREDEWRLRKAASLIKLLALAPGHRLHRELVMDLLWPELSPKAAANNLHRTLHVARRTLEPELATHRHVSTWGESLALCPNGSGANKTNVSSNKDTSAVMPAWSPNGARIAYVGVRSGSTNRNIYVMSATGGGQGPINTNPAHDISPNWQPLP